MELEKRKFTQVKTFDTPMGDNQGEVNEFLRRLGNKAISVTPIYNTILGGISYAVVYKEEADY